MRSDCIECTPVFFKSHRLLFLFFFFASFILFLHLYNWAFFDSRWDFGSLMG